MGISSLTPYIPELAMYDHSETQLDALITLFARYKSKIAAATSLLRGLPLRCQPESLISLCDEAMANHSRYPFDKLNRWLGFVQGILAATGVIDVDDEREFSRPLLHAFHSDKPPTFST